MDGQVLLDKIRNSTMEEDWFEVQRELMSYLKNSNSPCEMVEILQGYTEMVAMLCDGLR